MDKRFIRTIFNYKYEILIILFSFAYLWPVLSSGYYYDDIYNSTIRGAIINGDTSSFKLWADYAALWFGTGRVFPCAFYCYVVLDFFSFLPNPLVAYKVFLVILTLADILVAGVFIKQITGSKKAKLLGMLVCVLFFQVAVMNYTAIYSFHGLLQLTFLFGMLALIFLVKYLNTKKIRHNILSITFFLIALLMYEVGYAFIIPALLLPILLSAKKERFRNCLPHAIATAVVIAVNVYARMNASSAYSGVIVSLSDISLVSVTFLKQFIGAVPLTQTLFADGVYTNAMRQPIGLYDIVMLGCFAALACLIVLKEKKEDTVFKGRKAWPLVIVGCSLWIIPSALMAVSERYQRELIFGTSNLPSYAESFGIIFLLVIIAYWLTSGPKLRVKQYALLSMLLIAGMPILLINIKTMSAFFESTRMHILVTRNVTQEALADDFYESQNAENLLLYDIGDNIYTMPCADIFAAYANKKITAQDVNEYTASNKVLWEKGSYENTANEDIAVTKEIGLNSSGGIIVKGQLNSIILNDEKTTVQSMFIDNVSVYINYHQGISSVKFVYNTKTENGDIVEKEAELAIENGSEGQIVKFGEQELVDIKTIRAE